MTAPVIHLPTLQDEAVLQSRRIAKAEAPPQTELPLAPRTPEETGLPLLLLHELLLKVMHQHGHTHLPALSNHLKVGIVLLEALFAPLRKEALVEVRRRGALDGDVNYELTQAGRHRAADALTRNLYTGPAPVPLGAYAARVAAQSIGSLRVTQAGLRHALADVVLNPDVRDRLGPALNSHRAVLLYGPPGAGKSYLAEQAARLLHGVVAVPHAIEVAGEIIRIYDPLVHRPARTAPALPPGFEASSLDNRQRADARWLLCERPVVTTGGELTLEMLDLSFDARAGYYQAPPHFKANNGLFLIDDLGRQLVSPRALLNRWILPMESRVDYLMLRTGSKFQIPFDTMLLFSTNLRPDDVADEAFLRRIGYKVQVGALPSQQYREILNRVCKERGVPYSEEGCNRVLERHAESGRPLLACTPRDLVSQLADHATYYGLPAALTPELVDWAWKNYFASGVDSTSTN